MKHFIISKARWRSDRTSKSDKTPGIVVLGVKSSIARRKAVAALVMSMVIAGTARTSPTVEEFISGKVPSGAEAKKSVAALEKRFLAAFAARDAQAVSDLYTQDAKWLAPNAAPVVGRQAIRGLVAGFFTSSSKLQLEHPEVNWEIEVSGDGHTAFVQGRYLIWYGRKSGPPDDEGSFVHVLKKVDGRWLIAVDIFNSEKSSPKTQ